MTPELLQQPSEREVFLPKPFSGQFSGVEKMDRPFIFINSAMSAHGKLSRKERK